MIPQSASASVISKEDALRNKALEAVKNYKKKRKDAHIASENIRIAKIHDPGYEQTPSVEVPEGKGLRNFFKETYKRNSESNIGKNQGIVDKYTDYNPAKATTSKVSSTANSAKESVKESAKESVGGSKDLIKDTPIVEKVGEVISKIDTPVEVLGVGLGVGALALGAKAMYDKHKEKKEKKDMAEPHLGKPTIHNSELSPKEKVVSSISISNRIQEGSALHTMLQKDFGCSKKKPKGDMGVTKSALKGAAVGAVTGALTGSVPGALVGAVAGAGMGAVGQKAGEGIKTIEDARDRKKSEEIAKSAVLAQHGFSELSDVDNEVATYCYQYREADDKDLFLERLKDMVEPEIFEKVQERIESKDFSENSKFEYLDQLLEGVAKEDFSHPFS